MNKLLMISNFRNLSGYSIAAENNLKAIYHSGFPISARNINLVPKQRKLDDLTEKLLKKDASDANILLIHSLPEFFQYDGRFKVNIGYFDYETSLTGSNWQKYCELMDVIWVPARFMRDLLKNSGFDKPVDVVPHPVDINRFTKSKSQNSWFSQYKKATKNYLFYTISEFGPRKNYECLLKAWHSQFHNSDKADLIIKTHKSGWSNQQLLVKLNELNEIIKKNLRVSEKYTKNPIFITDDWSDEQIDLLHQDADCFVSLSHCECWPVPPLDACCFGKPVIVSNCTGFLEYVNENNGYLINGEYSTPYGVVDSPPQLYNCANKWFNPNFEYSANKMKHIYKNKDEGIEKGKNGRLLLDKFNYHQIGKLSKQLLENYL